MTPAETDILRLKRCPQCQYDLSMLPPNRPCPECGHQAESGTFDLPIESSRPSDRQRDQVTLTSGAFLVPIILLGWRTGFRNSPWVPGLLLVIPLVVPLVFWFVRFRRRAATGILNSTLLFGPAGIAKWNGRKWSNDLPYGDLCRASVKKSRRGFRLKLMSSSYVFPFTWFDGSFDATPEQVERLRNEIGRRMNTARRG